MNECDLSEWVNDVSAHRYKPQPRFGNSES